MHRHERDGAGGFSLLELLLALSAGLLLAGVAMQAVYMEARGSQQIGERLRERALAARALVLVRTDAARATALTLGSTGGGAPACGLAGRKVLLHLEGPAGPITYSVGQAPSAIWRGAVLMRCGTAFGLNGEPSRGAAQNRVVLDGLMVVGTQAEAISAGAVRVTLQGRSRMQEVVASPG